MSRTKEVVLHFGYTPPFARAVLRGVIAFAHGHGRSWHVRYLNQTGANSHLRTHPDGAIVLVATAGQARRVRFDSCPTVNLLHDFQEMVPSVVSDDRAIGRVGAEALLARGFTRFAFLGTDRQWSRQRESGFVRALHDAARECQPGVPRLKVADYREGSPTRLRKRLGSWLRTVPRPLAVMTGADFISTALLDACETAHISVPEEIAILGVDNDTVACELASVPLSSIEQDFERLGGEAARLLDRLMSGRRPPARATRVSPGRLIERRSTDVFAFEDANISAALHLIHEQAACGLTVKQLLRQVPVSRAWLDLRFRQLIGRSPGEEIRRLRLDRVRERLATTSMPVHAIACECGFSHVQSFSRFFHDAVGVSPSRFREHAKV